MAEFCINCQHQIGLRLYDKPPPGQEWMPAPFNKPVAHAADGTPLYDRTAFRYPIKRHSLGGAGRDWDSDPGYSDLSISDFK